MSNVISMKAQSLDQIADKIRGLQQVEKNAWYEIGLLLGEARQHFTSNIDFGQWCQEKKFEGSRPKLFNYRVCAELVSVRSTSNGRLQDKYGYSVISEMAHRPEEEQDEILRLEAEGKKWTVSSIRKDFPTRTQAEKRKEEKVFKDKNEKWQQTQTAKMEKEYQKKLEKYEKSFEKRVAKYAEAEIQARVEEEVQVTRQMQKEAFAREMEYKARAQRIDSLMSKADYRLVLGCLHPDRDTLSKERLRKAFIIFKKIEPLV